MIVMSRLVGPEERDERFLTSQSDLLLPTLATEEEELLSEQYKEHKIVIDQMAAQLDHGFGSFNDQVKFRRLHRQQELATIKSTATRTTAATSSSSSSSSSANAVLGKRSQTEISK